VQQPGAEAFDSPNIDFMLLQRFPTEEHRWVGPAYERRDRRSLVTRRNHAAVGLSVLVGTSQQGNVRVGWVTGFRETLPRRKLLQTYCMA